MGIVGGDAFFRVLYGLEESCEGFAMCLDGLRANGDCSLRRFVKGGWCVSAFRLDVRADGRVGGARVPPCE